MTPLQMISSKKIKSIPEIKDSFYIKCSGCAKKPSNEDKLSTIRCEDGESFSEMLICATCKTQMRFERLAVLVDLAMLERRANCAVYERTCIRRALRVFQSRDPSFSDDLSYCETQLDQLLDASVASRNHICFIAQNSSYFFGHPLTEADLSSSKKSTKKSASDTNAYTGVLLYSNGDIYVGRMRRLERKVPRKSFINCPKALLKRDDDIILSQVGSKSGRKEPEYVYLVRDGNGSLRTASDSVTQRGVWKDDQLQQDADALLRELLTEDDVNESDKKKSKNAAKKKKAAAAKEKQKKAKQEQQRKQEAQRKHEAQQKALAEERRKKEAELAPEEQEAIDREVEEFAARLLSSSTPNAAEADESSSVTSSEEKVAGGELLHTTTSVEEEKQEFPSSSDRLAAEKAAVQETGLAEPSRHNVAPVDFVDESPVASGLGLPPGISLPPGLLSTSDNSTVLQGPPGLGNLPPGLLEPSVALPTFTPAPATAVNGLPAAAVAVAPASAEIALSSAFSNVSLSNSEPNTAANAGSAAAPLSMEEMQKQLLDASVEQLQLLFQWKRTYFSDDQPLPDGAWNALIELFKEITLKSMLKRR